MTALASILSAALVMPVIAAEQLPPGFYRMDDGTIMANNPATAIAPPGYYLRSNGVLIKLDEGMFGASRPKVVKKQPKQTMDVPAGFHRMPDGRIMANNPGSAVAPPGYHLMPDGTLMSNDAGAGGAGHAHHGAEHGQGMWMFEYRYSRMNMKDLLDTTDTKTADDILSADYGFMMSPTAMNMDMHMLMGMYGITNKITIMLMTHYMSNSMVMKASDGTTSTMRSSGLGDSAISFFYTTPVKLVAGFGVGLPTGSIDHKGDMVMSATSTMTDVTLPYAMQLGSGSFELRPSLEYNNRFGALSIGSRFEYIYRANDNHNGYRLGDRGELSTWTQWHVSKYFSTTAKLNFINQAKISDQDKDIVIIMNVGGMDMLSAPTADPSLYGGLRLDGTLGIQLNTANRMWGLRTEVSMPLYQNLWGPQMKTNWILTTALEAMF